MNNAILNSYSGIKTHQFGLDSISNNIANVNTTGYRESRAEFETLFAPKTSSNGPTSNEINLGVSVASNAISTKSGNYRASDGEFDLAYQGKGWFVVGENKEGEMEIKKDTLTQKQQNFFTRDGSFGKDSQGYLVNSRGYYVYGVNLGKIKDGSFISNPKDDAINLATNKLSPLQIPQDLKFKPLESTDVKVAINLNQNQDPISAYESFVKDGKIDEERLFNTDLNIFFTNSTPLDLLTNKDATITIKDQSGAEQSFTFNYGKGDGEFRTLKELQTLIKDKTGLNLTATLKDPKELHLQLSSPSLGYVKTDGGVFSALGMIDTKEKTTDLVPPYNPTQTYAPNQLTSYLGITFKKINSSSDANPIENTQEWEIVDTQGVKNYQEGQSYSAGEVVKRDGNIYLMDEKNQFLKIGEEKTYQIPEFDSKETYPDGAFVQYQNKLYKKVGQLGNTNPQEDPLSWKEISLGTITSRALELPHYKSSVDIYDENGKKYRLISQYTLTSGYNPQDKTLQGWDVESFIQDIASGEKIGESTHHKIAFDENKEPIAQNVELDFKGKKIAYSIAGTDEKKSSIESYTPSQLTAYAQDGSSEGLLERVSIDENGIIFLKFSNGKQEAMGRIGIVAFTNDQGLSKAGGNLFGLEATLVDGEKKLKSGNPILGWNEEGNLTMGNVKQGYLETSNVDVGNALTELILMQRGYSMNAKSFTTGDEMIKEAINLKK